jgi:hypothetical protein
MNEKLPYEESLEQQLTDLPLPDEEQSWEKMQLLLDKDDDDDRILPPVFLKSCLGWSLLFIGVLAVLWFLIRPEKWWSNKTISKVEKQNEIRADSAGAFKKRDLSGKNTSPVDNQNTLMNKQVPGSDGSAAVAKYNSEKASREEKKKRSAVVMASTPVEKRTSSVKKNRKKQNAGGEDDVETSKKNSSPAIYLPAEKEMRSDITSQKDSAKTIENKISSDSLPSKKDSVQKDSLNMPKEKPRQTKKLYVTAGLGIQQAIPLAGQHLSAYNFNGKKMSLTDYMPFVYLQLHHKNKWFIQGTFHFAAPQAVKSPQQNKISFTDVSGVTTTNTYRLQKTFNQQLGLSFNYQMGSKWFVGAGAIYNHFYRAIVEEETERRFNQNILSVDKQILSIRRGDSSAYAGGYNTGYFKNTHMALLLQTGYEWKKFSFDLSYIYELQPFMKYYDPNLDLKEEKQYALQLGIRYRLWRTKK